MKLPKALEKPGFRQFVSSTGLFCLCFIIISFVIGATIVPGPLLYKLWFFVYGGMGYILLAMGIFFVIYARKRLLAIKPFKRSRWLLWLLTALLVIAFRAPVLVRMPSPRLMASSTNRVTGRFQYTLPAPTIP